MAEIVLTSDLRKWAETEVAAGRARDVSDLVLRVLAEHRDGIEALRRSLLEAENEAERDGWIKGADFLAEIDGVAATLEERASRKKA